MGMSDASVSEKKSSSQNMRNQKEYKDTISTYRYPSPPCNLFSIGICPCRMVLYYLMVSPSLRSPLHSTPSEP